LSNNFKELVERLLSQIREEDTMEIEEIIDKNEINKQIENILSEILGTLEIGENIASIHSYRAKKKQ